MLGQSLALYRRLDDKEGIASSLAHLGLVATLGQRDLKGVPALHREAVALREEIGDRRVLANLRLFSGVVAIGRGAWDEAVALHEEALALFRELQDIVGVGHCMNNLGLVAVVRRDYDEASSLLEENLRMARESGYKLAIYGSFLGLAAVAASEMQPDRAARLWGAREAMEQALGIPAGQPSGPAPAGVRSRAAYRNNNADPINSATKNPLRAKISSGGLPVEPNPKISTITATNA